MSLSIEKAMSRAKAHEKKREFEQARQIYMAVLGKFPNNARARKALDALGGSQQSGQVIDLPPNEAQTLITLFQQGNFEAVLRTAQPLAARYASSVFLWDITGLANAYLGRYDVAERCFRNVIRIKPDYADAYNNLGMIFHDQRRLLDARDCYEQVLKLKPYDAEAHNKLGAILIETGDFDAAAKSCLRAIDIDPGLADAYMNLSDICYGASNLEKAAEHCGKALSLRPDDPEILTKMGTIYSSWGRFDEAADYYKRSIANKPEHTLAYALYGNIHTFESGDPLIAKMEDVSASASLQPTERAHVDFALAKAYDDLNETDAAFGRLKEANRLRKERLGYDIKFDRSLFAELRSMFSEKSGAAELPKADLSPAKHAPVFILGMPRSGTTLVEQIVAGHADVHTAGELDDLARTIGAMRQKHSGDHAAILKGVREGYLQSLEKLGVDERYIIDKMPLNFRWIGYIACAFPEAKIVNLVRDPRAVCWSVFRHNFGGFGNGFAYDLEDVAHYHVMYAEMMDFWRGRFPGRIHDVDYRALTEDPETHARELFGFLGLDWQPEHLEIHKRKGAVRTLSKAQVRQKIYTGSSEGWRRYEAHLQPMIRILGDAGLI
ncbi:MAG: sulfotransferase [Tepidamorphaceae bacterium]|nr:sulfotransferase [Rhodobiaceae bacterium]MCC0047839.1 sulfotransferase [Rhodobiaceae bacterium]